MKSIELFRGFIMKKRKLRLKKKNFCLILTALFSTILIIANLFYVIPWILDNHKVGKEMKKIKEETPIIEKKPSGEDEKKEEEVPSFNPYWDFIKMNYLEVDFSNLKKTNNEVVAWVLVNGTNINYPVVQHSDNKYYLTHSFDRSKNSSGWVFMDYRNNSKEFQKNTILYAHGRKNGSMFGTLKNVLDDKWLQENHDTIRLSTPHENSLWQVFSVYKIHTTNDYIQTDFSSDEEYSQFLHKLQERSIHHFSTTLQASDKILTLSTCFNEEEKVVLHAKLVQAEER